MEQHHHQTKPNLVKIFGSNVKRVRKARKLSQEKLAELTDLHRTYIGMVERGERTVSIVAGYKIALALGVSLDFLLSDKTKT